MRSASVSAHVGAATSVGMLDKHVGLSDTRSMTTNALPAPGGHGPLPAVAAPVGAAGVVFDTLGMPMSVTAAKAMTKAGIQAALERAVAKLHHEPVGAVTPSALMDSIEVVFLIGRFYRNLGHKQPDLSKIDRNRWSTLEGVAEVLLDTTEALS